MPMTNGQLCMQIIVNSKGNSMPHSEITSDASKDIWEMNNQDINKKSKQSKANQPYYLPDH